ncbi:MAG: DUF721 domain-containing protein [Fibrobacter sp.]|uniref:DUF721 domain-containing protein n=1 Tax=Fibrobacter sp. TaxID=35828 RepID=UPI003890B9BB|nr:DUF721 domain-containing protein [Fibrobacter sp.]
MPEYFKRRTKSSTGGRVVDIAVLLERVLDSNHIAEDMNFKTLSERFSEVVGEAVLPHVKPVKLDKRTLVLKADSSAWKAELFMQKNAIIDKCNSLLGRPFVRAVRFA